MKKVCFLLMAVFALLSVSCSQKSRLTISPSSVTVKINTPTTVNVQYGYEGNDIQDQDIDKVGYVTLDGELVAKWDGGNTVTGYKVGDWNVGVVVRETPHDENSKIKYSAYMTIHVVE